MTKKEHLFALLERMGYKPNYDDENDLFIIYQMKHIFFMVKDEDEDPFMSILYPQFAEPEEGQEPLFLAAANKLTRETKLVKVFIDQTFSHVSAACEFYYANDETLEFCIRKALRILGLIRTAFNKTVEELDDSE